MFSCPFCSGIVWSVSHSSSTVFWKDKFPTAGAGSILVHHCGNSACKSGGGFFECDKSCNEKLTRRSRTDGFFSSRRTLQMHWRKYHCQSALASNQVDISGQHHGEEDDPCTQDQQSEPIDNHDTFAADDFVDDFMDCQSFDGIHDDNEQIELNSVPRDSCVSQSLNTFLSVGILYGFFAAICRTVVRAVYQNPITRQKEANENRVPSEFVSLFLHISCLVKGNGAQENQLFSAVLLGFFKIIAEIARYIPKEDHNLLKKLEYFYHIPTTIDDFSKRIENPTNSQSFHSLLPVPHIVHNIDSEHAMCSLTEVVPMAMFMPLSNDFQDHETDRYKSIIQSESFLEKKHLVPEMYRYDPGRKDISVLVYIIIWSDGWDPNRSNKGNRYPVWTATGTLVFVELGVEDHVYHVVTELLCAGPGKSSHNEFFEMLRDDKFNHWQEPNGQLRRFRYFSRHHNQDVDVFLTFGFFLQDNPEKRGAAELLAGNSNNHGIFGISCIFDLLEVQFHSCKSCKEAVTSYLIDEIFENSSTRIDCTDCLGFCVEKLCTKGRYKERITKNLDLVPGDHGYDLTVGPGAVPFDVAKMAWEFAIEKFINQASWNVGNTIAYLKLFCINDSAIDRFIKQAKIYINIREALDPQSTAFESVEERQVWLDKHQRDKTLFQKPPHNPIWDIVKTKDVVEVPMHLGMGWQKALFKSNLLFCSGRNKKSDFLRRCHTVLSLVKDMHIDIARILTFKDEKFGGYVAENYSALTMIIGWVSRILEEDCMKAAPLDFVPDPAVKPVRNWTGKECKAWLRQRGLSTQMLAPQAKATVEQYYSGSPSLIPAIIINPMMDLHPSQLRCLLKTGSCLFGSIMAKDLVGNQSTNRAQAIVAQFLSLYETLDEKLMPDRKKPIWIEKYNMLGLLRVPSHFERFSLFRNLHEGGDMGEGIVKNLRKFCPHGVRDGWSRCMLDSYYRRRSLAGFQAELLSAYDAKEPTMTNTTTELGGFGNLSRSSKKRFRRYSDLSEVRQLLTSAFPISIIILKSKENTFQFVCVVRKNEEVWQLHKVIVNHEDIDEDVLGYGYFGVRVEDIAFDVPSGQTPLLPNHIYHSCGIMLPDLWKKNDNSLIRRYAFIGQNWEHLRGKDEWTLLY